MACSVEVGIPRTEQSPLNLGHSRVTCWMDSWARQYSHVGWSSLDNRYWRVSKAWPIRVLVTTTSSRREIMRFVYISDLNYEPGFCGRSLTDRTPYILARGARHSASGGAADQNPIGKPTDGWIHQHRVSARTLSWRRHDPVKRPRGFRSPPAGSCGSVAVYRLSHVLIGRGKINVKTNDFHFEFNEFSQVNIVQFLCQKVMAGRTRKSSTSVQLLVLTRSFTAPLLHVFHQNGRFHSNYMITVSNRFTGFEKHLKTRDNCWKCFKHFSSTAILLNNCNEK